MNWYPYEAALKDALRTINVASLEALARTLHKARELGATVFTCGNGGSWSNAQHLAQDLCKGTWVADRPSLKTYHLGSNPSALTAYANDDGYESVFSSDLSVHGQQGDVLIAISGSGHSPNVLDAVMVAHELEMRTWGICGFDGGHLLNEAHRCVHVKCGDMGLVEAVHGIIFHWLVEALLDKARAPDEGVRAWSPGVEVR